MVSKILGVIHVGEVSKLVTDDIVRYPCWHFYKFSVESDVAFGRAGSSFGGLGADETLVVRDAMLMRELI